VIPNRFSGEESAVRVVSARAFALALNLLAPSTQGCRPGLNSAAPLGLDLAKLHLRYLLSQKQIPHG
jgi:hypothetical protein